MHALPSSGHPDPGCATFLAALDAVVDGEADHLSVARTEAHAAACPPCARRLRSARAFRARLRRLGEGERASEALHDHVRSLARGIHGSRTP